MGGCLESALHRRVGCRRPLSKVASTNPARLLGAVGDLDKVIAKLGLDGPVYLVHLAAKNNLVELRDHLALSLIHI